eukprot:scaffold5400_cov159-Ochromonas_danica.AAC.7
MDEVRTQLLKESEMSIASEGNNVQIQVFRDRWVMLAIFSLLEFCNAMYWVTFSPISDITQHYMQGSYYSSKTGVNMLANIFLIMYTPGTILCFLLAKKLKLKKTFIVAGLLTALGGLLRLIGALLKNQLSYPALYWIIFLGQVLAALAQPFFLNMPPSIAATWFPVEERDIATTIGSMFSPIGNAIGQIIPVLFVSESCNNDDSDCNVHGMTNLFLAQLLISLVPLAFTILAFKDQPPVPPSHSTKLKQGLLAIEWMNVYSKTIMQNSNPTEDSSSSRDDLSQKVSFSFGDASIDHLRQEINTLWNCRDYWVLFIVFSIGVGFFDALMTLLNQIIAPHGYSNDDAGTFGAVFIFCGIIGAGVIAYALEKTKAYHRILLLGVCACVGAGILFVMMLFSNNYWPLVISFGVSVLPLLPVMMENCAEVTYPVSEDVSMGSNLLGLAVTFILQALLEVKKIGPPPLLASNFFIIGILFLALFTILFYRGELKRIHLEKGPSDPLI